MSKASEIAEYEEAEMQAVARRLEEKDCEFFNFDSIQLKVLRKMITAELKQRSKSIAQRG